MSFEKYITKRKKVPFLSFVLLGILIMGMCVCTIFLQRCVLYGFLNCSCAPGRNFSLEQIRWDAICFHVYGMADVFLFTIGFLSLLRYHCSYCSFVWYSKCHLRGWIGFFDASCRRASFLFRRFCLSYLCRQYWKKIS